MALDLATVKLHCRIDDGETEDVLLQGYLDAAKAHVEQHCDRTIVDGAPASDAEMALTPDVEHAILLLVAHWYANREAVVVGAVPAIVQLGVERLLWYRKRF